MPASIFDSTNFKGLDVVISRHDIGETVCAAVQLMYHVQDQCLVDRIHVVEHITAEDLAVMLFVRWTQHFKFLPVV